MSVEYVDPTAMIEQAADPGEFVVQCLERGKTWLAEALEHGDLDALVNAKGYAETLRVATMQKQLGKDAQLSATELVRRAERCIGLGIRRGQEGGEIATRGSNLQVKQEVMDNAIGAQTSPYDYLGRSEFHGNGQDAAGIKELVDDVTDEQFEAVLAEARDEENLSRANLTRKLKPGKAKPKPKDRSDFHRGTPRPNVAHIIEETVSTLEAIATSLALIEPADYPALDAEKRLEWIEALRQPLAAINRMRKGLSE